jgi:hypothetical protein
MADAEDAVQETLAFAKTSCVSKPLLVPSDDGRVASHGEQNFARDSIRHSCAWWLSPRRTGKCGASSAVGRFQERSETSEAASTGPTVLDWAEDDLEELEIRSGDRSTGNSNFMAAQTIQAILVEVVAVEKARASAHEIGDS